MKPVRIGVLGCAAVANRFVIPAIVANRAFELAAIASRTMPKAQEFSARFGGVPLEGYDRLLERPDVEAVYIPLPNGLHHEWVAKALDAGKHVLVEKSLAVTLDEAQDLVARAQLGKLVLFENFMFLYHSQLAAVRDKVATGAIGTLRNLRSSFGFPPLNGENIRYDRSLGGGALLDAGAYTLKAATLFLGDQLEVVAASLSNQGRDVDTAGSAMLLDSNGVAAQVTFGFDHFYQCSLELWGAEGKITMERVFTAGPGVRPIVRIERGDGNTVLEMPEDNHFSALLSAFAAAIRQGGNNSGVAGLIVQARLLHDVRRLAICRSS